MDITPYAITKSEECAAQKILANEEHSLRNAKIPDARPLSEVLDALAAMETADAVSVEALVKTLGRRSFPTLVMVPSLSDLRNRDLLCLLADLEN